MNAPLSDAVLSSLLAQHADELCAQERPTLEGALRVAAQRLMLMQPDVEPLLDDFAKLIYDEVRHPNLIRNEDVQRARAAIVHYVNKLESGEVEQLKRSLSEGMRTPVGWKLVPLQPTLAMEVAYRQALNEYLERIPPEQQKMARRGAKPGAKYKGMRVDNPKLKLKLRWQAMVNAAPEAPRD